MRDLHTNLHIETCSLLKGTTKGHRVIRIDTISRYFSGMAYTCTWGIGSLLDDRGQHIHWLARCRLIRFPVKSRYAERSMPDARVTSGKR